MAKELITADNVEQFVHDGKLCMDNGKILTPGARDLLSKKHIEIVYGEPCAVSAAAQAFVGQPCCNRTVAPAVAQAAATVTAGAQKATAAPAGTAACCNGEFDEDVLVGVAAIIKRHYNITNPEDLRRITLATVRAIAGSK